jgi:tRNA(adenine34) deaminase
MECVLLKAKEAVIANEVPVAAGIFKPYSVTPMALAHNQVCKRYDSTAHAEIEVIREVSRIYQKERLDGLFLVTTIEPCIMCAGAILEARIDTLIIGASEEKFGAFGSIIDILATRHPRAKALRVIHGVLRYECGAVMSDFFKEKRV